MLTNCPKCNGESSLLFKAKDYNRKIINDLFIQICTTYNTNIKYYAIQYYL